jgi:hypothetical protein
VGDEGDVLAGWLARFSAKNVLSPRRRGAIDRVRK